MTRKRLTQIFPLLIPLRTWEKKKLFYLGMKLDFHHYAHRKEGELPYPIFQDKMRLINLKTGFPIIYQENKVFNLKLAVQTINHIIIRPHETFSFWQLVRHAEDKDSYKEGLCVVDGNMKYQKGGGLCQLSNLLFWLFLHTPMTIVERHSHQIKDFPMNELPLGVDATVLEGWCDLKVKNETNVTFQLSFSFDDDFIYGTIWADQELPFRYEIVSQNVTYLKKDHHTYESVLVYQTKENCTTKEKETIFLYQNTCQITYEV